MDNIIFWIIWAATFLLAGWVAVDAVLTPRKLLEWPVLCSVMWLYFYVYMAYDAVSNFQDLFTSKALILGQLMALLSLAGLLYGWYVASKTKPVRGSYGSMQNSILIYCAGLFMMIVGVYGGYNVQVAREAGGYDYANNSAYAYLLFYVGYPGLALSLWVACCSKGIVRIFLFLLTLTILVVFLYPHVSYLRRGPTFPAILLLLTVPPLATGNTPNRTVYISGLAILGVLILSYLPLRKVIYNKGTWAEALTELSLVDAVYERGKDIFDNEYINNCHMIEAITVNGKYQYGTGHGSLFLHWIPRSFWKNKPILGEGYYSNEELLVDVEQSAGISLLLGSGAAAGGVADAFVQYGFLTPLFFGFLGWVASTAYWKGRHGGSLYWMHIYIAILCATHWLISQGFAAAFVPMLAFLLIPLAALRFIGIGEPIPIVAEQEVPRAYQS